MTVTGPPKNMKGVVSDPLQGVNIRYKNKKDTYTKRGYGKPFSGAELRERSLRISLELFLSLARACESRQTLVLALMLHRQADMRRGPAVKLPIALLNPLGFNRKAVSRALQQLERANLVRVHRKPGTRSAVTVLWHPSRELRIFGEEDVDEGDL